MQKRTAKWIIGIDPSYSNTGVCVFNVAKGTLKTFSVASKTVDRALIFNRAHVHSANIVEQIAALAKIEDSIVCIERLIMHNRSNVQSDLQVLFGMITKEIYQRQPIGFMTAPPTTLKLFFAGKGNADKTAMVTRARDLGHMVKNDDEADAIAAALFALKEFGHESS
jgi:Holliday junction resolvasome RuvABC endonuclease subunit